MPEFGLYELRYSTSWALVVGINKYQFGSPLEYACNDANDVADVLHSRFGFPSDNIVILTDESATRERINLEYLSFANEKVEPNDRIVVFFAGHGYTKVGSRGEVGFLVPVDGNTDDLSTLLRWDELTRNAEFISAKHMLFIMDACYGGLAVTRYLHPGSMRFVKDMLQRYSRQVLTAGKANEAVADAGGPRPGHSMFTGHLLEALEGAAATSDGILTANGVMAYVYNKVARDYQSQQTPHYGFIDGDGDLIFDTSVIEELSNDSAKDKDILVEIPPVSLEQVDIQSETTLPERLKEYLSDPKYRIVMDDFVTAEIRRVLAQIGEESFPIQGSSASKTQFADRLRLYEERLRDLMTIVTLLGRWAGPDQRGILKKVFARMPDTHNESSGLVVWLGFRWYPIMLIMYAGGIAALAANDYDNLSTILATEVGTRISGEVTEPIIIPTVEGMLDVDRQDLFKTLPGHEKNYVPRSEYLFKVLQPILEDVLFLGRSYEQIFDRFEVYLALVFADLAYEKRERVWGPPGRFAWKYSGQTHAANPFTTLTSEAGRERENWGPLRAGLFRGSYERFKEIADGYQALLEKLNWW